VLHPLEGALEIAVMVGAGYAVIYAVYRLARGIGVTGDSSGLMSEKPRPFRDTGLLTLAILWLSFGVIGKGAAAGPLLDCSRQLEERRVAAFMIEEEPDSLARASGDTSQVQDQDSAEYRSLIREESQRCQDKANEYGKRYAFASVFVLGAALVAGRDAARKRSAVSRGKSEALEASERT
jgi:hypothetical protein